MQNPLYRSRQLRRFAISILALGLLGLFQAVDIYAQGSQGRETVAINISRDGNGVCTYEIDGENQNQDLFLVRPNAAITFSSTGTKARVEIERHHQRGKHAGRKGLNASQSSVFDLEDGTPVTRNARVSFEAQGKNHTTHKVWIFCLNDDGNEQVSIDRASAGTASIFGPSRDRLGPIESYVGGPFFPDTAHLNRLPTSHDHGNRRGEGGPDMEVEDP